MATAETKFFGLVEFDGDSVWSFPSGLPGFETHQRFLPLQRPGAEPVVFLQSLQDSGLCFVTMPVNAVEPNYRLEAPAEELTGMGFSPDRQPVLGTEAICLAILTLAPGKAPTANLMSPVLVNLQRRQGMQVIQTDTHYTHQHPLTPKGGA